MNVHIVLILGLGLNGYLFIERLEIKYGDRDEDDDF